MFILKLTILRGTHRLFSGDGSGDSMGCGGEVSDILTLNKNLVIKYISDFGQFYGYRWLQICIPEKVIILGFLWVCMKGENMGYFLIIKFCSGVL